MTLEERIRLLLRAATRAEGEGDVRVAESLRRMAEDALPAGPPGVPLGGRDGID